MEKHILKLEIFFCFKWDVIRLTGTHFVLVDRRRATIGRFNGSTKETRTRNDGDNAAKVPDIEICENGWPNWQASAWSDGWFI